MNLENEYYSYKKLVNSDEEKLTKFEVLDITSMNDSQLESYHRGVESLKINEGAKFSIKINKHENTTVCVIPQFNGETVELNREVFFEDPYTYKETIISDIIYDKGYIIEIPKSYFDCDDIIKEYTDAFEKAFIQSKSLEFGIFAKYGENVEQQFEQYSASEVGVLTDETINDFLKNEELI